MTDHPTLARPDPAAGGRSPVSAAALPQTCGQRLRRALRLPKALCALRPVQRKRRVFSGGLAPGCLKRKLVRSAQRSRQLHRLCGWVEKPPPRPHLRVGPLLGRCLEDLVAAPKAKVGSESVGQAGRTSLPPYPEGLRLAHSERAAAREGRPRQAPSVLAPEPWVTHRPLAMAQLITRPQPGPYALAAQAAREILNRFMAAPAEVRFRRSGIIGRLGRGDRGTIGRASSAGPAGATARHGVEMAARLARGLARFVQSRLGSVNRTPGPGGFDGSPAWALAALAALPAGPSAPLELLMRAAGAASAIESLPNDSSVGRRSAGGTPSDAPPRRLGASSLTPGGSFLRALAERSGERLEGARGPIESFPLPEAPAPRPEPPEGARQGFYPQTGALSLPEAGPGGGRPLVAPPLAADTPPTLLQPRFPFDAPSPFAAAALRRDAKHDEVDLAQEDLDLLAAKIKRILDEEARRHGIGV